MTDQTDRDSTIEHNPYATDIDPCLCDVCLARHMRETDDRLKGREIANHIGNYVNRYGDDPKPFCEGMNRQHRTLQQNFTRLCIAWFDHLAKLEPGEYDLRNQGAVEFARKLTETEPWKENTYLPHV